MEITILVLIGIITGVVQAVKVAGLPSKYASIFAIAISLGLILPFNGVSLESVVIALVVGLSSTGLYENTKNGAVAVKKALN